MTTANTIKEIERLRLSVSSWKDSARVAKARAEAAEAKLARLADPDEGMVEAVMRAYESHDVGGPSKKRIRPPSELMREAIRALAAYLKMMDEES